VPDAISHLALVWPFRRLCPTRGAVAALCIGSLLPDVWYNVLFNCFQSSTYFSESGHVPLVLLFLCYFLSMFFAEADRKRAFFCLLSGSLSHVAFDTLKNNMGEGAVPLAFPFTRHRFELGVYWPENAVYVMLFTLLCVGVIEGVFWLARRLRAPRVEAGERAE